MELVSIRTMEQKLMIKYLHRDDHWLETEQT